jgi:REP element-mobilizing transposase RayT
MLQSRPAALNRHIASDWASLMNDDEPLAYFATWTVYGTFLQGDHRGWRKRRNGEQRPQPHLANWHKERLNYPVMLLDQPQQMAVEHEIDRHCEHRGWHIWSRSSRTNHVHVVVTAVGYSGKQVRDQLKANCTRGLRAQWSQFRDRPIWTVGGDWECINTEDDLEAVILYVEVAQDRKGIEAD